MNARNMIQAACLMVLVASSSACFTTTLRSGLPANAASIQNDRRWHHGVIWGIAEISGPYDLKQICPEGWAEVTTETSFLNWLLYSITSGIYTPQTVTIRCSGAEADGGGEDAPSEGDEPSSSDDQAAARSSKHTM
jgi:hypothetical protein